MVAFFISVAGRLRGSERTWTVERNYLIFRTKDECKKLGGRNRGRFAKFVRVGNRQTNEPFIFVPKSCVVIGTWFGQGRKGGSYGSSGRVGGSPGPFFLEEYRLIDSM